MIYGGQYAAFQSYNCYIHHNVVIGTTIDGEHMLNNQNWNDVFVGSGTSDGKYQLPTVSAARGVGKDGADCGVFWNGGYVLSGIPSAPVIASVNLPVEVSNSTDLKVDVSIRTQP